MADSFVACYMHCVFSTKERRNDLYEDLRPRVFEYISGIARNHHMRCSIIGGTDNHVHVLLSLPRTVSISQAIRLLKANSSRWIKDEALLPGFSWQRGYGAFSVSASDLERVRDYIARQEEHHKDRSFEQELLTLLDRYGVDYDPQYVFD